MLTYKDKTFCSRVRCANTDCDRHEINIPTSQDQSEATGEVIYVTGGLPIAWADFLPICNDFKFDEKSMRTFKFIRGVQ